MKSHIAMATVLVLISQSAWARASKPLNILTENAINNGDFPLPRLSSGYDPIKFTQGHYKKGDVDATADMIAFGTLDGQPAAVAYVVWSTGGTSCWEVLGLYRVVDGNPKCVRWYDLEDRSRVNSIRISGNKVILDWVKHGPADSASDPSVHEIKRLRANEFETVKQDNRETL
jgi:hypothetical protein